MSRSGYYSSRSCCKYDGWDVPFIRTTSLGDWLLCWKGSSIRALYQLFRLMHKVFYAVRVVNNNRLDLEEALIFLTSDGWCHYRSVAQCTAQAVNEHICDDSWSALASWMDGAGPYFL